MAYSSEFFILLPVNNKQLLVFILLSHVPQQTNDCNLKARPSTRLDFEESHFNVFLY